MDESKVLSTEEVDALLKVTQEKSGDLTSIMHNDSAVVDESVVDVKALTNICELTWAECETLLTSFLRKKISVKLKGIRHGKFGEFIEGKTDKHVFTVFLVLPFNCYGLVVIDLPILSHVVSLIYGAQDIDKNFVMEHPGKIGTLVAKKISQLVMDSFVQACKEYGTISYETVKTVTLPNLISKLAVEDKVYTMDLSVTFNDVETLVSIIVAEDFIFKFIPVNAIPEVPAAVNQSWRTAIQKQVVDSYVTLAATLPEITMNMQELMALKSGDLIQIGDPTSVNICLNNTKLFYANAGQANSIRVVKIVHEY